MNKYRIQTFAITSGENKVLIRINDVTKFYKNRGKLIRAIDGVSCSMEKGELVFILGQNGAGKTTLIKSICGLVRPDKGQIFIDTHNIIEQHHVPKEKIGVVLEGSRNIYYYLSCIENLKYFGLLNNLSLKTIKERAEYLLNVLDLKGREHDMVKIISRGTQQKVAIMIALLKDPEILILDEPTLGLDIFSANMIKQLLRKLSRDHSKTIIITTHDISLIKNLSKRVIFIKEGKIVCDKDINEIRNSIQVEKQYEIILKNSDTELKDNNNYEVIKKEEELITVRTSDIKWLGQKLTELDVRKINLVEPDFNDIYQKVLGK